MKLYEVSYRIKGEKELIKKEIYANSEKDAIKKTKDKYPKGNSFYADLKREKDSVEECCDIQSEAPAPTTGGGDCQCESAG